ncbi:MAG: deoxyribonuclease IV [Myxococcaceae bacterium]
MLIGAHESVAGGVSKAFARAEEHGGSALQIFTKTARGWNAPALTDAVRKLWRTEARRTGLRAMAHGSYLTNLGSEDPIIRPKSLACLEDEHVRAERLGLSYLVIHPGCHADVGTGVRLIADAINELHRKTPRFRTQVCLEGTAGQGTSIGWRFEHLAAIFDRLEKPQRVGVCLDTCHLFAAGYDVATPKGYRRTFDEFEDLVGLDRLRCFHLNDCKKELGCRVDRHEEVGKGRIGLGCFKRLVNDERFRDVPGVLETPFAERYGETIRLLKRMERL